MIMRKRIWTAVVTAICIVSTTLTAAAETGNRVITFKGEAEKFVKESSGNPEEGFSGMQPGESRDLRVTLSNDDAGEMKFYMNADILDNIADKGNQEAVYYLDIARDGDIFFQTVVGNEENAAGKEYLDENNNILLGTLAQGEETEITITLTLDGDSAGNDYMNESGSIRLIFSVATPDEEESIIKTVTKYLTGNSTSAKSGSTATSVNKVKTGDDSPIWAYGLLGAGSVILIGILLLRKRKSQTEE